MEASMLERYEVLAAWGSAVIVALITALAVPLAAEGTPTAPAPTTAAVQAPR